MKSAFSIRSMSKASAWRSQVKARVGPSCPLERRLKSAWTVNKCTTSYQSCLHKKNSWTERAPGVGVCFFKKPRHHKPNHSSFFHKSAGFMLYLYLAWVWHKTNTFMSYFGWKGVLWTSQLVTSISPKIVTKQTSDHGESASIGAHCSLAACVPSASYPSMNRSLSQFWTEG